MNLSEQDIEAAIKEKGLTGPRLTADHISAQIAEIQFHIFPGTTLTVCALTLKNGFNVTGESACVSLENFDEKIGKDIAFDNARQKIWALEGYLLRSALAGHVT
jgi:hypothetical protein